VDMKNLQLRVGIFGAELWSNATRDAIEDAFGIKALNMFGLSEMMGPGIAAECLEGRQGMHIFEDHFIVETINPKPDRFCPKAKKASWSSRASPKRRFRSSATAPATFPA